MNHSSGSCAFAEELVSYLYGEMNLEAQEAFESHLPSCDCCTSELAAFQEVRETLCIWKQEVVRTAPAGMISRVTQTLRVKDAVRPRSRQRFLDRFFRPSLGWAGAAAALGSFLLVATASYGMWRSAGDRGVQSIIKVSRIPASPGGVSSLLNGMARMATEVDSSSHSGAQPRDLLAPGPIHKERLTVAYRSSRPKSTRPSRPDSRFSLLEERQLLADLGVASSQKEETAPRLSDLLGEPDVND